MQNRNAVVSLFVVLVLGLVPLGFGQISSPSIAPQRVLGYFNPQTGLFEPLRTTSQESDGAQVTPTTGTLVFNFTITLKTSLPSHGLLLCSAAGAVIETGFSADESGFGFAHFVSGNTYSCSVSMPYSWLLSTRTTDKIILSYHVETIEGVVLTATNGTSTVVATTTARSSSQTIPSIAVPVTGTTTTTDVAVTL